MWTYVIDLLEMQTAMLQILGCVHLCVAFPCDQDRWMASNTTTIIIQGNSFKGIGKGSLERGWVNGKAG